MDFNKKILCLGNNSQDTDTRVTFLSEQSNTKNHGLITDINQPRIGFGYYHTSIYDMEFGKIKELIVAYKDRLTRFGFELIEELIATYSKGTIKILNEKELIKLKYKKC